MNLKQKRLMELPVGTAITVHYSAGTFSGVISDRDKEYLEISDGSASICLKYSDVEMYVSGGNAEKGKVSRDVPAPKAVFAPKAAFIPAFMTEISQPLMSDKEIRAALDRNDAQSKKVIIDRFNSITHSLKENDKAKANLTLMKLTDDIAENAEVSARACVWEVVSRIAMRIGELKSDYALRARCYEDAARYYMQKEKYSFAGLFCALALCFGEDTSSRNEMYTIAFVSCKKSDDAGAVFKILSDGRYPDYNRQLLRALCSYKGIDCSDNSDMTFKMNELAPKFKNNNISVKFDEVVDAYSLNGASPSDAVYTSQKEQHSLQGKTGQIIRLLWSKDEGIIEHIGVSGKETISFSYDAISEEALKNEISSIYTSDVKGKNLHVYFDIENGKVLNIRKNETACRAAYYDALAEDTDIKGKTMKEILKQGRAFVAKAYDNNRFYKAFALFDKALTQKGLDKDMLAEFYNCCLALNNAAADSEKGREFIMTGLSYLRKAASVVKHDLKYDVSSLGILQNFGTFEEKTEVLERLIAYPSVGAPQKLYYVTGLADAYFKEAEAKGKTQLYEAAAEKYALWETVFWSHPALFSSGVNNTAYYSKVLVNYAKCLILSGKGDSAAHIISKIRVNAPDAYAVSGLENLISVKRPEQYESTAESPEEHSGADEFEVLEDNDTADSDFSALTDDYEDSEEEDVLSIYADVDDMARLGLTTEDIMKYVFSLKGECAHVYSLAYLNAAAAFDKKIASVRDILSIALDEPFHEHGYNADEIITAFNVREEQYGRFFDYCFAAAALRSIFSRTGGSDYLTDSLGDMMAVSSVYPDLKALTDLLLSFKKRHSTGIDTFAPYRLIDKEAGQLRLNQMLARANAMYQQNFEVIFRESKNQMRFKLTKAYIYSKNEQLEVLMRHVKDNDWDYFLENRSAFEKTFIRPDSAVSRNNISDEKIDAFIDYYWAKAGESDKVAERKTSDLMGALRNNLKVHIKEIVAFVCDWAEFSESREGIKDDADGKIDFMRYSPEAAELIDRLREELSVAEEDDETAFSKNILCLTLKEIKDKLTGEWSPLSRKYFYADFLSSGSILLDSNFRPDLESTFCSLEDFNIFIRLREHFEDTEKSLVRSYERIFSRDSAYHNFGTAALIEEYASECSLDGQLSFTDAESYILAAENKLKMSYNRFIEDIQLANGKGQIMLYDDFMNTVNDTAYYWYKYCLKTKNYGFFFAFIESVKRKIRKEAASYEETLTVRLNDMLRKSPELFRDDDVAEQLAQQIREQNFLVAEDWMNRLSRNDFYDNADSGDDNFDAVEVLGNFFREYDRNFESSKDSGLNLSSQVRRGGYIPAKDKKGGIALISSWLSNGNRSTPTKIKTILNGLGWDDIEVSEESTSTQELYKVKLTGSFAGNKVFQHPFAAFGTASAFSGFYAACLYGYYNADRIIDKYKALDSIPGNKIVFLDFALSAAERRTLARKTKETALANTYILVDRVALLYVANNFTSGSNNRTLMAITLPFSYSQPYVVESSHDMPPEMFIGRKEELLSIESPTGANIIFGGRQLGKSALLKKAKKDVEDPGNSRRAVFLDLKGTDYKNSAKKISYELVDLSILPEGSETDDWDELERAILRRLRDEENPIAYLLLLLDEADTLIKSSEGVEYLPIVKLKNIQQMSSGRFKFVLAGLHNLVRFNRTVSLGNNSVIPHISYINITPFDYGDAKQLLLKPSGYLGFSFENNEVIISQILAATNYFPGLIQLYCKKLIEAMKYNYAEYNESETPPYRVSETHIKKVLSDPHFREQIKEKFDDTLFLDADDGGYYYSAALLIALISENSGKLSCSVTEISEEAKKHGLSSLAALEKDSLEAILDELCCLNILMKDSDCAYSFSTKNFRDMMGSAEDIEEKLLEVIGRGETE